MSYCPSATGVSIAFVVS